MLNRVVLLIEKKLFSVKSNGFWNKLDSWGNDLFTCDDAVFGELDSLNFSKGAFASYLHSKALAKGKILTSQIQLGSELRTLELLSHWNYWKSSIWMSAIQMEVGYVNVDLNSKHNLVQYSNVHLAIGLLSTIWILNLSIIQILTV